MQPIPPEEVMNNRRALVTVDLGTYVMRHLEEIMDAMTERYQYSKLTKSDVIRRCVLLYHTWLTTGEVPPRVP